MLQNDNLIRETSACRVNGPQCQEKAPLFFHLCGSAVIPYQNMDRQPKKDKCVVRLLHPNSAFISYFLVKVISRLTFMTISFMICMLVA